MVGLGNITVGGETNRTITCFDCCWEGGWAHICRVCLEGGFHSVSTVFLS